MIGEASDLRDERQRPAPRALAHGSAATGEVMRFDLARDPPYVVRLQHEWAGRDWPFELL